MISYLKDEIRGAFVWIGYVLIFVAKIVFRWLLRIVMLWAVLFVLGKGCINLSLALWGHAPKTTSDPSTNASRTESAVVSYADNNQTVRF